MEPLELTDGSVIFVTGEIDQKSVDGWLQAITDASKERLTLLINSHGGNTAAAIAFCNTVRDILKREVDTVCLAVAASAAVPIFMLGQRRAMMATSQLLLHQSRAHSEAAVLPSGMLQSMAAQCALLDSQCAELIAAGSSGKVTGEQALAMMRAETLLTPQAAVDAGLATEIYGASAQKKSPDSL